MRLVGDGAQRSEIAALGARDENDLDVVRALIGDAVHHGARLIGRRRVDGRPLLGERDARRIAPRGVDAGRKRSLVQRHDAGNLQAGADHLAGVDFAAHCDERRDVAECIEHGREAGVDERLRQLRLRSTHVPVRVDEARHDRAATGIDDIGGTGRRRTRADGADHAAFDHDGAVGNLTAGTVEDARVGDDQVLRVGRGRDNRGAGDCQESC